MERLRDTKSSGLSTNGLRTWATILLALGVVGRGVFQTRLLGIGTIQGQQLLEIMQASPEAMTYATIALVCQALETCAVPLFALLLVEGFQHTSSFKNYFLRVAGVAVLSELPYNLSMSGKLWDAGTRNPVFAMVLGLALLFFYNYYEKKSLKSVLIKALVLVAALVWTRMLRINSGFCIVLLVCVLWVFRKKPIYRNLAGATASMVCSLSSIFYLAAPMSFMAIHFYNGERGNESKLVSYLSYPAILLLVGLLGTVVL